jgi:hypothetical protein
MSVEPSILGRLEYRPCEVTLRDGSINRYVYVQEEQTWFTYWGVDPEDDAWKQSIPIEDVVTIAESPYRIPAAVASRLYREGEGGNGYYTFALVFADGYRRPYMTSEAVDFINWPPGRTPEMVVDVILHAPEARVSRPDTVPIKYFWCLYEGVN